MQLIRAILPSCLLLAMTCCHPSSDQSAVAPQNREDSASAASNEQDDPGLFADEHAQSGNIAPAALSTHAAATPPPVACDPTAYCAGPLLVKADRLVMSSVRGSFEHSFVVRGTLSFENRSNDEIRLILLREPITINLDNGATAQVMFSRQSDLSGLHLCQNDGQQCLDERPDDFRVLRPAESPAKVNITFRGNFPGSLTPTMGDIKTGVVTLSAFVASPGNGAQQLEVALSDVPIVNQMAK